MGYATCQTDGCDHQGIAYEVELITTVPETGETHPTNINCGTCDEQITDTSDDVPDDRPYVNADGSRHNFEEES